jgi:hypothetical protein
MNPSTVPSVVVALDRAKKVVTTLIFLGLAAQALAQEYVSSEDRSRFSEQPYKEAEPGLLPPSAYIEMAKKAFHEKSKKLTFLKFSDGIVTRRFYRNAPPADRDIICVQFVYEEAIGGGGLIGPRGFIYTRSDRPTPVIQALIRKDLSKIYLKQIHYKAQ